MESKVEAKANVRTCDIKVPRPCNSIAEYMYVPTYDANRIYYYCKEHKDVYVNRNGYSDDEFTPIQHTIEEIAMMQRDCNPMMGQVIDSINNLLKQRGNIYGDIRCNMNCQEELMGVVKRWYNSHQRHDKGLQATLSERDMIAWQGCMEMVMHKIARMITGDPMHLDNYDDGGGYLKLMKDIVSPYRNQENDKI